MKFQIYPRADGKFGYRLVGANGEKMFHAEGFASQGNAHRAIKAVKGGVKDAPVEVLKAEAADAADISEA